MFGSRKYVIWNWGNTYEFGSIPLTASNDCVALDALAGASQ